ncbi:MAG: 30S ribosomal protein S7 [Mycoplasmataceae bacterium RV_VA103A]|nr:MAG: 30S ribosomal protein S7 [Mycoplasmataceae bacterium RV_VA103A]
MRKKKVIKKHVINPDPKFASVIVSRLINKVMKNGEKRKARKIVYEAAQIIEKKTSLSFLTVLEGARANSKPGLEMKSRRVGAEKRRVPKEIGDERGEKIVLRWLVEGAHEDESPSPMSEKLAKELLNAYNKSGAAYKKKENLYKEAESGRVFSR